MQGRYSWWFGALVGLALAGQPYARGDRQIKLPQPVEATVKFDLYQDYLIVARGSVGSFKNLNFVLDTGASPTILDRRLAQKLHLEELPASMAVLEGKIQAGKAMVPAVEFGPIRKNSFPVMVQDLSFFQRSLPVHIDAVIGLDVLGQSSFVVDYTSHEIQFGPLPSLPVSIPLRGKEGLPIVDAELNDAPVHLLLDTGAPSLVLFETRIPGLAADSKVGSLRRATNLTAEIESRPVQLKKLRLGSAQFKKEPAFMVQDRSDSGRNFDGLMSPAALGITRVAFDFERGVLAFSR